MRPKSLIFLGDLIDTDGQNVVQLFDDYTLKQANKTQVCYIKNYIDAYTKILSFNINRYEYEAKPNKKGGHYYHPLEKKDWNYWVVEHSKVQMDKNFSTVLGLSQLDLTVLFQGIYSGVRTNMGKEVAGIMGRELTTVNFFHDTRLHKNEKKKITNDDKKEIKQIYSLIASYDNCRNQYDFIDKALGDFLRLWDISKQSPFKVLGYFSILELLLTKYRPRTANESSLCSQLKKKINLLNNQFENKIDITKYFNGPDTNTIETIIGKLYQYRNDIAHGNKSDFENELQILKDKKDNISDFLRTLLKKVLIHAISEPQLIRDLKEC
jgi:hypothetical protein